tara:strand:+ start:64 stop:705 length:642 start_codon:yes stop_codon:yes gene_type:complete
MRIFIDSANTGEIIRCLGTGLIDGVTTNPSLLRKVGKDPIEVYKSLEQLGVEDVSMEVVGNLQQMEKQANKLISMFGDMCTVKLPMNQDGLMLCKYLSNKGVRTNVTLIFNAAQALLAAKAGATYVSPFVGRIDDQGYSGLEVVRSIADLYKTTGLKTQVLAASIRTPHRAVRSYYNGADVVTMPSPVFWQMFEHVLTESGLRQFEVDYETFN